MAATEAKTVIYCDPWATGGAGPHISYPDHEDGTRSRSRLTLRNGNVTVVAGSVEERAMRAYLERRYGNPDTYKGETLVPGARCNCGFATVNREGAKSHKARWPDHQMEL